MCIFIHIYSFGIYVQTWGMKRRWRNGEKAGIYASWTLSVFWFSFSFEKRTCAYLFAHEMGRRPRKSGYLHTSVAIILWFFPFPCNKKCASIRTSKCTERGEECVHTWWMEKEGKKKGKEKGEREKGMKKRWKGRRKRTKTLSSFCTAFYLSLLCFSLLFLLFFLDLKKGERGGEKEEDCHYYYCSPRTEENDGEKEN